MKTKKNSTDLEVLFNLTSDILMTVDSDGFFVNYNSALTSFLGFDISKLDKPNLKSIIVQDDLTQIEPLLNSSRIKNIKIVNLTLRLIDKDNTEHKFNINGFSPPDEGIVYLSASQSVTDTNLANSVNQKLTDEQLINCQKLESISMIAGGLANDYNNLLTGVIGNVALVKSELDSDDELFLRLEEVENAAMLAKDLTSQLMSISSTSNDIHQVFNIYKIIRNAANLLLKGEKIIVSFDFEGEDYFADVNRQQFRQLIYNILMNAKDAMPNGGKLVIKGSKNNIRSGNLPPGEYIMIDITDEGYGIKNSDIEKVFDPYFTTKPNSNGLGLTTSSAILRNHNGSIEIESEEGEGTTVSILIPASDNKPLESTFSNKQAITEKPSNGRILVMDDEDFILKLARRVLIKGGFEVETARDGMEAINLINENIKSNHPFDLVILDLIVSDGMSGQEAIVKIKEIDPEIKAIVCSGYSGDPVLSLYEQYGFDAIVNKPYRPSDLTNAVKKVLKQLNKV